MGEKTTAGTDEFEFCLVRCRDTGSHSRVINQMRPPETKTFLPAFKESSKRVVNTVRAKTTCKFFEKLDAILGHRPPSAPSVLLMPDLVTDEPSPHNGVEGEKGNGDGKQCIIIISYFHSTIVFNVILHYSAKVHEIAGASTKHVTYIDKESKMILIIKSILKGCNR